MRSWRRCAGRRGGAGESELSEIVGRRSSWQSCFFGGGWNMILFCLGSLHLVFLSCRFWDVNVGKGARGKAGLWGSLGVYQTSSVKGNQRVIKLVLKPLPLYHGSGFHSPQPCVKGLLYLGLVVRGMNVGESGHIWRGTPFTWVLFVRPPRKQLKKSPRELLDLCRYWPLLGLGALYWGALNNHRMFGYSKGRSIRSVRYVLIARDL